MLSNSQRDLFIKPAQLCVGLYVHLDLNWSKHPFSFSSFKIDKPEQVAIIHTLGLEKVRYSPHKSDCLPLALAVENDSAAGADVVAPELTPVAPPASDPVAAEENGGVQDKANLMSRMAAQAQKLIDCEREFLAHLELLKTIWKNLLSDPLTVAEQARGIVGSISESAMMESDVAIHLMIEQRNGTDILNHAMNVTVLSMVLAKEMGRTPEEIKLVGLGALFHDVACADMPRRILEKGERGAPLIAADSELLMQHCKKGVDICNKLHLPYESLLIIWQHHERIDGSGYPEKLKDKQISPLANIVAVANAFDELCNPLDEEKSHTAHESLSIIYAQQRSRFDPTTLTALVHCLGVYPPGTVVLLSNGFIGMVVAVNPRRPLKPLVLIYDAANVKNQPIVIDIEAEIGLNVNKTINPAQLSPEMLSYFAPGKRASYYIKGH